MSSLKHIRVAAVLVLAASGVAGGVPVRADGPPPEQRSVIASFDSGWIRLADGWGEARACTYDGTEARCYRSEAEMDRAEASMSEFDVEARADCAQPTLKLYCGGSYGGSVFQLTSRGIYHDLGLVGFSNVTSSYKIGPCNARFYDVWSASGLYPGTTTASTWSTSMSSGWNDRVSSVYIT